MSQHPDQDDSLQPAPSGTKKRMPEHKRRRRELILAAVGFLVVLVLITVQLEQYRTGGGTAFVVLFNINMVILAGILVVVLRNGLKLLLERRRRTIGSRLRTRLVLAFVALALLPCLLMFLVTTKYVQLSMDFWFKIQMETSMETALDVARESYERSVDDMAFGAENIQAEVAEKGLTWSGRDMDVLLERKRREYRLSLLGLYSTDGRERNWHATEDSAPAWSNALKELDWRNVQERGTVYIIASGKKNDYLVAIYRAGGGRNDFFAMAKGMGPGFKANLDMISRGAGEYKNLRNIKQPLKGMLYSSLGILTILILLGATWFGFRLARELSAPILALVAGTQRIARGDLSVRLDDTSADELGTLVRSFNTMAEDLEESRRTIVDANSMLEDQNLRIAGHSTYIETVLDNIAAGVVSFDQDGIISTANRASAAMLGVAAADMVGQRVEDILPEPHRDNARAEGIRFRQSKEKRSRYDTKLVIDGEEKHLLINVVGFSTEGVHRGSVAVFEDISELERMQRMAAWREVARRIAHEIKNPLTPIKLSAQRLARKFGPQVEDPAFAQSTQLIVRQVEYLQDMVQEFSAFAKLPEVTLRQDDLSPLLVSITDFFRNSHSNIRWELDIPAALPQFPMDREALHRAFMNIYTNAAEALNQAGTQNPAVVITAVYEPEPHLVRIDVADNGPGLTEEEVSRLFEPYFSRKKGGTGLGLTIVRSIVTEHRGYIRGLIREGGGTVLVMELPLA